MQRWVVAFLAVVAVVASGCGGSRSPQNQGSGGGSAAGKPTVVILDGSGSMNTADAPGSRIDAAKAAVGRLVEEMADSTDVGLVTYGTQTGSAPGEQSAGCRDVSTLVGLGRLDRDRIRSALAGVKAQGYTPIGLSLQHAVALLPQGDRPEAVVLVSDGEDTCGVPPCEVAGQLKAQRPGLTISTVGFRTGDAASDQLGCIAAVTGGVFVTADNAAQLAARLGAVRDVAAAKAALSSNGIGDIRLGMKAAEIVAAHSDFPAVVGSGSVTVVYRDCEFGFVDGVLDAISPHGGGRTIDGIGPGSPLAKGVELYGAPLAVTSNGDGTTTLIFDADPDPDTDAAYRILADGYTRTGDTIAGTVKTIILCRCKPRKSVPQANVATFEGYGPIKIGMTESEVNSTYSGLDRQHFFHCTVLAAAPGADYRHLSVWIDDKTGKVTGIDTPKGTSTDRNVGDGSSASDVTRAYQDDATFERMAGQGGMALVVRPKEADSGSLMAFGLGSDDTISQVTVGRIPGWEGC